MRPDADLCAVGVFRTRIGRIGVGLARIGLVRVGLARISRGEGPYDCPARL